MRLHMDSDKWCPWISCFDNNADDPFHMFKDLICLNLEEHINKVANQLQKDVPHIARKDAQNIAINMLMERLLILQKEHTPQSQKSMIINLFSYLPELKDFRYEFVKQTQSRTGLVYKIKKLFNKKTKHPSSLDSFKF